MRAFGGPEQLTADTVPEAPKVGAEELLVDVEAAGINYLDVYQRSGRYKLPLPYTPGFEGVGRVRWVGAGVSGFASGNRVAWINVLGSYASQVIVPAAQAISVPDQFTTAQALMFQSLTAPIPRHRISRCASRRQGPDPLGRGWTRVAARSMVEASRRLCDRHNLQ